MLNPKQQISYVCGTLVLVAVVWISGHIDW